MRKVVIVLLALIFLPNVSSAAVLFSSKWDNGTGSGFSQITDGGKWYYNRSASNPNAVYPYVVAGTPNDPGGYNFLRMTSVGGGYGGPYLYNFYTCAQPNCSSEYSDVFKNPDNIYIRLYFRVSNNWQPQSPTKHWLQGNHSNDDEDPDYLCFNRPGELSCATEANKGDYVLEIQHDASDARWQADIHMLRNKWYCYEVHIQKTGADSEKWEIRLDGVDITDKFFCVGASCPDWSCRTNLKTWFQTNSWKRYTQNMLYLTSYDMANVSDGWDISAVEVRDDTWPGPIFTNDTQPPTIPNNLTALGISSSQISLSWSLSTDNVAVAGYKIYRCQGAGCSPTTQIATSPTNSYSDTGLSPSTNYTYTVAAFDVCSNTSAPSASVSATTLSEMQFCIYDLDQNSRVEWADVILCVEAILNISSGGRLKGNPDVNSDGSINIKDVLAILQHM